MNFALLMDDFHLKKDRVLNSLLMAGNELISLTGLQVIAQIESIEEVSQIMTWLSLQGLAQTRLVNDSINGESRGYYTTKKQKTAISEYFERVNQRPTDVSLSSYDKSILQYLLDEVEPVSVESIIQSDAKLSKNHINWRVLMLHRHELISRKKTAGNYVYFLNDEQRTRAMLSLLPCPEEAFTEDGLREAVNLLMAESSKRTSQYRQLQTQVRGLVSEIKDTSAQVESVQTVLSQRQRELKELRLTKVQLDETAAVELSLSQDNPVALSERLSFIRNLQSRPALQGYHLLAAIAKDYEVALKLIRSR